VTFGFGKKTGRNYHYISVEGRYPIPLQTQFSGQSNCKYVGSHTDLATGEMQMGDCLYVSVPTRAKAVSRWAGQMGTKKRLDSTAQRLSDILPDRSSYSTTSGFSEAHRFMQAAALSPMQEGFDRNGGMK
jgi:hypothetical protein